MISKSAIAVRALLDEHLKEMKVNRELDYIAQLCLEKIVETIKEDIDLLDMPTVSGDGKILIEISELGNLISISSYHTENKTVETKIGDIILTHNHLKIFKKIEEGLEEIVGGNVFSLENTKNRLGCEIIFSHGATKEVLDKLLK